MLPPSTAKRVRGTVRENEATPTNPHERPAEPPDSGLPLGAIALFSVVMDNASTARLVGELDKWISSASPGAKLPSSRQIVLEYSVSPNTVQKAIQALVMRGVVETRPGIGTFVRTLRSAQAGDYSWQTAALGAARLRSEAAPAALRPTSNDVIALHAGYPAGDLLPDALVRAAYVRAARGYAVEDRPPPAGLPELQAWFADELTQSTPASISPPGPKDVVVVPGSQSGLNTAFRALVGWGQPLLVESPTYWGALLAAERCGVRIIPIPSGPEGPDPAVVDRAFATTGARAFYAQPNFANPTGAQWGVDKVDAILETVQRHEAFLIEDDWAHDFGIDSDAVPLASRDDTGHVVYLRSLTKSVSPAVRIAALIARGPARERILLATQAEYMYVSGLLQGVALDVVTQPAWRAHRKRLRFQLEQRRNALVDALRLHAPEVHLDLVPRGGLNLWARLPDAADASTFAVLCRDRGVAVAPGSEWFPAEPPAQFVRLNYSGPNPAGFEQGARIIGSVLREKGQAGPPS